MSLHDIPLRVLTVEYPRIVHILRSNVQITSVALFDDQQSISDSFLAIWDTGATNTVISRTVIEALALIPTGVTMVNTSHGIHQSYVYLIDLKLPSNVRFSVLRVTEGSIAGADVLLGMDILTQGDFVITNAEERTTFSFRVPPVKHIDFGADDECEK